MRVYLSTTLPNMHLERSVFFNHVLPKLRQISVERSVSFFISDMRGSVTQQNLKNGAIVATCLQEIDQCRP